MPEFVNNSVGSLRGTNGLDGTIRCPRSWKKRKYADRISAVFIARAAEMAGQYNRRWQEPGLAADLNASVVEAQRTRYDIRWEAPLREESRATVPFVARNHGLSTAPEPPCQHTSRAGDPEVTRVCRRAVDHRVGDTAFAELCSDAHRTLTTLDAHTYERLREPFVAQKVLVPKRDEHAVDLRWLITPCDELASHLERRILAPAK